MTMAAAPRSREWCFFRKSTLSFCSTRMSDMARAISPLALWMER